MNEHIRDSFQKYFQRLGNKRGAENPDHILIFNSVNLKQSRD